MILKPFIHHKNTKYGQSVKRLSLLLDSGFEHHKHIHLFHNVYLLANTKTISIDHLILHPFGLIVIDSNKLDKHLSVDSKGQWQLMKCQQLEDITSPVAKAQSNVMSIKQWLSEKELNLESSSILNFQFDSLTILEPNHLSTTVDQTMLYALYCVQPDKTIDRIIKTINLERINDKSKIKENNRPIFNCAQVKKIVNFILQDQKKYQDLMKQKINNKLTTPLSKVKQTKAATASFIKLQFNKECCNCNDNTELSTHYGPKGYYIYCKKCDEQTDMKSNCFICNSTDTKVLKANLRYDLMCKTCGEKTAIVEPSIEVAV